MTKQQQSIYTVGKQSTKRVGHVWPGRLLFGWLAFSGPGMAWAQATATSDSPMTGHLLQTTLGLLFVLGLLFALTWALKRMGIGPNQKRGGFYKVLAMSALGPREKIALIEVGDTWLVIGMTAHSINTLHSMPAGSLALDDPQYPAASFAKMLERIKAGSQKT
ncbi:MAG TPA: flagellar biosynthetic protein FliO [Limnobacter sp.]|nr:flagellar biosynthetic protein FliO [Limnobacter sp.]